MLCISSMSLCVCSWLDDPVSGYNRYTNFHDLRGKECSGPIVPRVRFRCAYVASGNGIAERSHRSVKQIAARKCCTIAEAVYWYNLAPKDDVDSSTAPANKPYNYEVRVLGIDRVEHIEAGAINSPCDVGDTVWVKPQGTRCNTMYRVGTVTGVVSDHTVEVDGMPQHVRDLRSAVPAPERAPRDEVASNDNDVMLEAAERLSFP